MSEFQMALLGAGAVVVAAVWGYNVWQERRHKQRAEKIFRGGQPDVLLRGQDDGGRIEPVASEPEMEPFVDEGDLPPPAAPEILREPAMSPEEAGAAEAPAVPEATGGGTKEPEVSEDQERVAAPEELSASRPADLPSSVPLPTAVGGDGGDGIADCTLSIDFPAPVGAPALWVVQSAWATQLTHALAWFGDDDGKWRRLVAEDTGRHARVLASLQLVDRRGAVSENELTIFFDSVQRLARQFGGHVDLPPRGDVLAHARDLDGFCAEVDVQLGVNVVAAGTAFAGTKLRGLAEAAGLVLTGDGRFHAHAEDGRELFAVGNMGSEPFATESLRTLATPGLTFILDVPRVAAGVAAFDRMLAVARQMAEALGGTLVDGQHHPLAAATLDGIRAKVGQIQQQMSGRQIEPGSPRALRLFS